LIVLTYIPDVPTAPRALYLFGNVQLLGGVRLIWDDLRSLLRMSV
jgi:hypothetical protein